MPKTACPCWRLLSLISLLSLSACAVKSPAPNYPQQQTALAADYFNVEIPAHDGIHLAATVYQPRLAAGETAPLIIHTHGFGGFRAPRPLSLYGQLVLSGEAAIAAWRRGYWVISYDQRGFGESEGDIHLMAPDFEVKDMSDVISWAEGHLPRLARSEARGNLIGSIGESYGAGVQLLNSFQDDRLDALVPIAGWYDLSGAIAPNGQVKDYWTMLLASLGSFGSGFDFGKFLTKPYLSLLNGKMNAEVIADLHASSPRTYCEQGQSIHANALFIQGIRDALFPLNQAYDNWQCARAGGRDARLLGIRDGHILFWPTQSWSGLPLFNTQPNISCDGDTRSAVDWIVDWLNEQLRPDLATRPPAPTLCVALNDDEGWQLPQLAIADHWLTVPPASVKLVYSGMFEAPLWPIDQLLNWLTFADRPLAHNPTQKLPPVQNGWLRPAFVPLLRLEQAQRLVGMPRIDLTFNTSSDDQDGIAYLAVGVRRNGDFRIQALSEQFTPLPGDGHYAMTLPALVEQLEPGDLLGLILQGFSGQYFLHPAGAFSSGHISGRVALPLFNNAEITQK